MFFKFYNVIEFEICLTNFQEWTVVFLVGICGQAYGCRGFVLALGVWGRRLRCCGRCGGEGVLGCM